MGSPDDATLTLDRTGEPARVRAFRSSLVKARHTVPDPDLDDAILLVNLGQLRAAATLAHQVAKDKPGFVWSDVRTFARRVLQAKPIVGYF